MRRACCNPAVVYDKHCNAACAGCWPGPSVNFSKSMRPLICLPTPALGRLMVPSIQTDSAVRGERWAVTWWVCTTCTMKFVLQSGWSGLRPWLLLQNETAMENRRQQHEAVLKSAAVPGNIWLQRLLISSWEGLSSLVMGVL